MDELDGMTSAEATNDTIDTNTTEDMSSAENEMIDCIEEEEEEASNYDDYDDEDEEYDSDTWEAFRQKRTRKSYTVEEKLAIVSFAERSSNRAAGRKFELAEKNIRQWRKMKPTLLQMPRRATRRYTNQQSTSSGYLAIRQNAINDQRQYPQQVPTVCHQETQTDLERKTRRSYTVQEKLKVIEYAEQTSNRAAARLYNVDEKNIRDWRRIRPVLAEMPKESRSLRFGAQPHWPQLEEELTKFVLDNHANVNITVAVIRLKAKQLAEDVFNIPNFKATTSWAYRFLKRHNLPTTNMLLRTQAILPPVDSLLQ